MSGKEMKDFLGNTYTVGDRVVYAVRDGNYARLTYGEVLDVVESTNRWSDESVVKLKIQPLKTSRGDYGGHQWIDNRTGKVIDPYSGNGKHIKEAAYEVFEDTGERVPDDYFLRRNAYSAGYRPKRYVPTVFHDYVVRQAVGAKPVFIENIENVVKVG